MCKCIYTEVVVEGTVNVREVTVNVCRWRRRSSRRRRHGGEQKIGLFLGKNKAKLGQNYGFFWAKLSQN
jgi:hypothetical protein